MKIKTYPLQFTEKELNEIKKSAAKVGMSMKDFMLEAIREKQKEN